MSSRITCELRLTGSESLFRQVGSVSGDTWALLTCGYFRVEALSIGHAGTPEGGKGQLSVEKRRISRKQICPTLTADVAAAGQILGCPARSDRRYARVRATNRGCVRPSGPVQCGRRRQAAAAVMRYPESASAAGAQAAGTGDWLSGRAPRSHRGGHWFDPSIAHQKTAGQRQCQEDPRLSKIARGGISGANGANSAPR